MNWAPGTQRLNGTFFSNVLCCVAYHRPLLKDRDQTEQRTTGCSGKELPD